MWLTIFWTFWIFMKKEKRAQSAQLWMGPGGSWYVRFIELNGCKHTHCIQLWLKQLTWSLQRFCMKINKINKHDFVKSLFQYPSHFFIIRCWLQSWRSTINFDQVWSILINFESGNRRHGVLDCLAGCAPLIFFVSQN